MKEVWLVTEVWRLTGEVWLIEVWRLMAEVCLIAQAWRLMAKAWRLMIEVDGKWLFLLSRRDVLMKFFLISALHTQLQGFPFLFVHTAAGLA